MFIFVPFLAVLDLLMVVFASLFINWWAPFLAVSSVSEPLSSDRYLGFGQKLPKFLDWFNTFDASLDEGWMYGPFMSPGWMYDHSIPFPSYWKRKWFQIKWLYRNPAYSFSYYVLGIKVIREDWKWTYRTEGTKEIFFAWSKQGHFNLLYSGPLGTYKLGWKIWNYMDDQDRNKWAKNPDGTYKQWGPELRTPFVFSVNPFKRP